MRRGRANTAGRQAAPHGRELSCCAAAVTFGYFRCPRGQHTRNRGPLPVREHLIKWCFPAHDELGTCGTSCKHQIPAAAAAGQIVAKQLQVAARNGSLPNNSLTLKKRFTDRYMPVCCCRTSSFNLIMTHQLHTMHVLAIMEQSSIAGVAF